MGPQGLYHQRWADLLLLSANSLFTGACSGCITVASCAGSLFENHLYMGIVERVKVTLDLTSTAESQTGFRVM